MRKIHKKTVATAVASWLFGEIRILLRENQIPERENSEIEVGVESVMQEREVRIDRVAFGGDGVGRIDGKVCFVPDTAPGELVRVRVIEDKKNFSRAEAMAVTEPSSARIEPLCPLARRIGADPRSRCPGCCYQHLHYREEVRIKQAQLEDQLQRLAGIAAPPLLPPLPSPVDFGYRNKLTLHAQAGPDGMALGYFRADNTTVLDLPACPLAVAPLNELLARERAAGCREKAVDGATVTLRWTEADGASCWTGRAEADRAVLKEATPCGEMEVPAGSFFQVNSAASGLLMTTVRDMVAEIRPACFVDLYCGVGFFSRAAAAAGVTRLIGIESDPAAARSAAANLKKYPGCDSCFLTGRVEKSLSSLARRKLPAETALLVDPPRGGLDAEALRHLAELKIKDLIYVSCAADTMCRDLKKLLASGYAPHSIRLVDMFPRTAHFETVIRLSHDGKRTA